MTVSVLSIICMLSINKEEDCQHSLGPNFYFVCMYVCMCIYSYNKCGMHKQYTVSPPIKGEIDLRSLEKQLIIQNFAACRCFGPGPAILWVYVEGEFWVEFDI